MNIRNNQDKLYSLPTCAEITNESVAVWRKRVFWRRIDYVKCGRNVRIPESALLEWIKQRTVMASGEAG